MKLTVMVRKYTFFYRYNKLLMRRLVISSPIMGEKYAH